MFLEKIKKFTKKIQTSQKIHNLGIEYLHTQKTPKGLLLPNNNLISQLIIIK